MWVSCFGVDLSICSWIPICDDIICLTIIIICVCIIRFHYRIFFIFYYSALRSIYIKHLMSLYASTIALHACLNRQSTIVGLWWLILIFMWRLLINRCLYAAVFNRHLFCDFHVWLRVNNNFWDFLFRSNWLEFWFRIRNERLGSLTYGGIIFATVIWDFQSLFFKARGNLKWEVKTSFYYWWERFYKSFYSS